MSENFGSGVTPEAMLRFSVDDLYAAGASLGILESTMKSPKTTFEELQRRAEAIDFRARTRTVRCSNIMRDVGNVLLMLGMSAFAISFVLESE